MRALATLGLAALLSSCAALPAPPTYEVDPAAYDTPLRARIVDVSGRLLVQTSRPAHVAIFEIVPGRGVGLLYPAFQGERNYIPAGLNTLFISQSRMYYSYFQAGMPFGNGPRYLYMIASDAPLRLSSLIGAPGALRRSLGVAHFASSQPYGLMDQLADMVLPYGTTGDWDDDVFVVWPNRTYDLGNYRAEQWIRVRCPDGRVLEGPSYYVLLACQGPAEGVPPLLRNPEQPEDSAAVRPPTRRRPEPREGTTEEGHEPVREPVVEAIPEPEPVRRPRGFTREAVERESTDDHRTRDEDSSPRVRARSEPSPVERHPEPRAEPRVEPRQEPRQEPRVESRPEPRSVEPRSVEIPRSDPPRSESPRAEPTRSGDPARR